MKCLASPRARGDQLAMCDCESSCSLSVPQPKATECSFAVITEEPSQKMCSL